VGRHLFRRLGPGKAVATYCSNSQPGMVKFNSLTMDFSDLLEKAKTISHAVLLLGDTQPDTCAADIPKSYATNVESIKKIIDILHARSIPCIFTSSEFVFDGEKGNYTEESPANPILVYGRQKLEVERYLEEKQGEHTVLRLAKVYGDTPGDRTLFTGWVDAIMAGTTRMRCAADQAMAPVWVEDVVSGILAVISHKKSGLFHMAGPVSGTRLDFLKLLLKTFSEYKPTSVEIETCSIHDFPLPEKRPVDVSMRPDKLIRETGISLHGPDILCRRIVERYLKRESNEGEG
jgi:dTDP-4-dehydrorhamnose reductase